MTTIHTFKNIKNQTAEFATSFEQKNDSQPHEILKEALSKVSNEINTLFLHLTCEENAAQGWKNRDQPKELFNTLHFQLGRAVSYDEINQFEKNLSNLITTVLQHLQSIKNSQGNMLLKSITEDLVNLHKNTVSKVMDLVK